MLTEIAANCPRFVAQLKSIVTLIDTLDNAFYEGAKHTYQDVEALNELRKLHALLHAEIK